MTLLVEVPLAVASAAVLAPALVLLAEVVAARSAREVAPAGASGSMRDVAVLMPAHDEATGIAATVAGVLAQLEPGATLLVVADNCTDRTADVARAAGATVVERHDPERRGKGYALDFGMRALAAARPDVVIVVDADCELAPGALVALAGECRARARPVQALYLMRPHATAGLGLRIAHFAWIVKNHVRPLGARALGWPCQLMGTGMAFPWSQLSRATLASGHLVEDMKLGLDLAAEGSAPWFCPAALVGSDFPSSEAALGSQRTRWEHGHVSVIVGLLPKAIARAIATGNGALLAMAADAAVPPLSSLVLAATVVCGVDALAWGSGVAGPLPAWLAAATLACVFAAVVLAWRRFGREAVTAAELLSVPRYIASKLPIYARLLLRRQTEWVRTKRDGPGR